MEAVKAKVNDFEPLVPIDIIKPPQQRGDVEPEMIPPLEPAEVAESEIERRRKIGDVPSGTDRPDPKADIPYKGDVNAPVDAEHPLANPPEELQ